MRLLVLSDIHVEFGPFSLPDDLGAFDVAVFAGDIGRPLTDALAWIEEQRKGPLKGRPAILVPGNHEFYQGEINAVLRAGQELANRSGIHLLAPGFVAIGDVRFIGCTLWTDYNLFHNPSGARRAALRAMNDHRLIQIAEGNETKLFTPQHAANIHHGERAFIERHLAKPFEGASVVVTHHAPHPGSIQPRFRGDPLTPAYASDLTAIIDKYQPQLWVHGHDHGSHDYLVGQTRILSNQAGYPRRGGGRENPDFNPRLIIEVGA